MRNIAKVTYTDGHTSEAPLTPRVITSCEEHAQKEGWAAGDGSRIRQSYYMAYLAMRFAATRPNHTTSGSTTWTTSTWRPRKTLPNRRVARRLARQAQRHPRPPLRRHAWAWRNEASELDWGTAIGLLEQEMERMEEAEHGA